MDLNSPPQGAGTLPKTLALGSTPRFHLRILVQPAVELTDGRPAEEATGLRYGGQRDKGRALMQERRGSAGRRGEARRAGLPSEAGETYTPQK